MTAVSADLPDIRSALLLTDRRVHVIERWTRTAHTALQMDAVGAAPGFFCDEAIIGTNSIGMAASTRGAALVRGFEHYADAFTHITCASRSVLDPLSGQVMGVVNMTVADPAPWQLMAALVGRVVHETQQRLLDEAGSKSIALYDAFLQARRRAKGPMAAVDGSSLYVNAAGSQFVASTDRETLWTWAQRCVHRGTDPMPLLTAPHRQCLRAVRGDLRRPADHRCRRALLAGRAGITWRRHPHWLGTPDRCRKSSGGPRGRRLHQSRGRHQALHLSPHRGLPPSSHLPKTGHRLPDTARENRRARQQPLRKNTLTGPGHIPVRASSRY